MSASYWATDKVLALICCLQLQPGLFVDVSLQTAASRCFSAGGHVQDPPRDPRVHVPGGQSLHPALLRARPGPPRHRFGPAHRRVPDRHQPQEEEQGQLHRWGCFTCRPPELAFRKDFAHTWNWICRDRLLWLP